MAKPNQRTSNRAFHHKVRSGCETCKKRKIKCDEAKPVCLRCRASSLVCEGYCPPKVWMFELPKKGLVDSDMEHRLLAFSHGEGIKSMTLYKSSSQDLFSTYAPQLAYSHPAAKHALLALSAQYQSVLEHVRHNGSAELARRFRADALIHYNRGMKTLARVKDRQVCLEVLVLCSILFTGMELWPQKNMAPHIHILHALRICQIIPSTTIHSDSLLGYLLRILYALAENVASFDDNFTELSMSISDEYADAPWLIPSLFRNSVEAVELVDTLVKRVARLDTVSAGESQTRRRRLWDVHQQLCLKIDETMQQCSAESTFHSDLKLLRLHLRIASIMLRTNMSSDEMSFDNFLEDFEQILSESEELLAFELQPGSERGPMSVRSSLGLIPPLFMVATKCRASRLRRRALELLHGSRRRERLWNSCIASMLAETVVDTEDHFVPSLVPESTLPSSEQRVCLSHVEFDREKGQILIEYIRMPWNTPGVRETVVRPWLPNIDDNYETVLLSHKSLRAYGYTGTILVSPRITCQCGEKMRELL